MKKALNTIVRSLGTITFYVVIASLIFLAYGGVDNKWYRVATVEGNSMSPSLWFGDYVVITPPTDELHENNIILMSVNNDLVIHRIVGFDENGSVITKGDANEAVDNFSGNNLGIIGIVRLRIPWIGYPFMYARQTLDRLQINKKI